MQNGGYYDPRPSTVPSGAYGGWAGFRDGPNAPPYRQPPPPPQQQQMTPQRREEVLMEAGRLAAEHLVAIGELPPHVLQHQHRPPAPPTFQLGPFALPRPRPFQERPLARQRFGFLPPVSRDLGRPFQGRAIAKRPRPFQGRQPPLHPGRLLTQAALNDAPAGDGSASQPVSQSGDTDQSSEMNQR